MVVASVALELAQIFKFLFMPYEPKPFTGEMWTHLLVMALRFLNEEQRAGLCIDLYDRSNRRDKIRERIEELEEMRAKGSIPMS